MHPRRLIFILGTAVFAKGLELQDGHWTISVWLDPGEQGLGAGKPDLIFPTLMRNFDQAFALVEISVRDHLRDVQAGQKVRPTGIFEMQIERQEATAPGRWCGVEA
jgi:hypothetical protein